MYAKRGIHYILAVGAGANNAILPPNPNRISISLSGGTSGALYVAFGAQNSGAASGNGHRYTDGQPPLHFHRAEIGDLICSQLNVYNAGSAGYVSIVEGLD